MSEQEERLRLSDKVLDALQTAIDQEELDIAEILRNAMDLALTNRAGGETFVERRGLDEIVLKTYDRLEALREKKMA